MKAPGAAHAKNVRQHLMKTPRQHWRGLFRLAGGVFLVAGGLVCFHWSYTRGPARRLSDPDWLLNHSDRARWAEEQANYRRTDAQPSIISASPDLIGWYGDKEWALWLAERFRSDKPFRVCGCTGIVLSLMTNHDLDIKDLAEGGWVDSHKSQTQEEWIRDGFKKYGVSVHLPPTDEDTVPLLQLLGRRFDETNPTPHYVQYNAFRWLRDGAFWSPLKRQALRETMSSTESTEALLGFSVYDGLELRFPPWKGLGLLSFAEPWDVYDEMPRRSAWDRYRLPALFIALLSTGAALVAVTCLRREPRAAGAVEPRDGSDAAMPSDGEGRETE